ncbi:hypothetical protein LENED_001865 [Lentinula edodes]|uniref:Uncharacterized protein n=1 Tax=Lentinula edodes TaxID=5353 RepID=A0A1Q3DZD7_LENED|nr:hypothetical protein LENED_001865 [Lentinula edodes]
MNRKFFASNLSLLTTSIIENSLNCPIMTSIPLIIAQYELFGYRKGGHDKHWSRVTLESREVGHIFEHIGDDASTFGYEPRTVKGFSQSQRLCGGYQVGKIAKDQPTLA